MHRDSFSQAVRTVPSDTALCSDCSEVFAGLESITVPEGVTAIGVNAFAKCVKLKEITIPASVTDINTCAFIDCTCIRTANNVSGGTEADNNCFTFRISGIAYLKRKRARSL